MNEMSEHNRQLMRRYGITTTTKQLYWYKHYCYEKWQDAINYAVLDSRRPAAEHAASIDPESEK